jgi:lysophospholipase-2
VQVSVRDEEDVLRAVQSVHAMIDREIAAGTNPQDVFVFGLSQGGALGIASVLLHPKTLGGCAVFSGFLPFNSSFAVRVTAQAKKLQCGLQTPVLWIHGQAGSLIPIKEGRDGIKFLRGLGMSCEFKVYDRLGHSLEYYELDYCQRWVEKILHRSGREGLIRRVSRNIFLCSNLFNSS